MELLYSLLSLSAALLAVVANALPIFKPIFEKHREHKRGKPN